MCHGVYVVSRGGGGGGRGIDMTLIVIFIAIDGVYKLTVLGHVLHNMIMI